MYLKYSNIKSNTSIKWHCTTRSLKSQKKKREGYQGTLIGKQVKKTIFLQRNW